MQNIGLHQSAIKSARLVKTGVMFLRIKNLSIK